MTGYFGPEHARKPWEIQVETPVGQLCLHCEEAIEAGDVGTMELVVDVNSATRRPSHYECSMRSVIGSVAHVEGTCSCNIPGSSETDPEGMSRREAARAAVAAWARRR